MKVAEAIGDGVLIEAVFGFRWGRVEKPEEIQPQSVNGAPSGAMTLDVLDIQIVPMAFAQLMREAGFTYVEPTQVALAPAPFSAFQFRQSKDSFPVVTFAPSTVSVAQAGITYNWLQLKELSEKCFKFVRDSYGDKWPVNGFFVGWELRYKNALLFADGKSEFEKFREKTGISIQLPSSLADEFSTIDGGRLNFGRKIDSPKGLLVVDILHAKYDEDKKPGFLMDVVITSGYHDDINNVNLGDWLAAAHDQAKATFSKLH